jgi:hypothetical protein
VHISLQNPIYLLQTKAKVLEITVIDLWLDKDEIHTPRMHP